MKFLNPASVAVIVFLLVSVVAVATDGKIDYKELGLSAISGYYGYTRGNKDE